MRESSAYAETVGDEVASVARAVLTDGTILMPEDYNEIVGLAKGAPPFASPLEDLLLKAFGKILKEEMTVEEALSWAQGEAKK